MKIQAVAILGAMMLLAPMQNVEAKNKGGGGGGSVTPSSRLNIGLLEAVCLTDSGSADAQFVNDPSYGQTVQLRAQNAAVANASVVGLSTNRVTALGAIQFSLTGSSINNNFFVVEVDTISPGSSVVVPNFITFGNGGIQKAASGNLYFIGINDRNGFPQLPAGGRIVGMTFHSNGNPNTNTQVSNKIYGVSFTGFGGVGFDLTSPSASCPIY